MSDYRMSYELRFGPPKEKDDLGPQEGLTDMLLVVSIMGRPGVPEPCSLSVIQVGPTGAEDISLATAMHVAASLLGVAEHLGSPIARAALAAIRKAMGLSDPGAPPI